MNLFQKHWKYKPARKSSDEQRRNIEQEPPSIESFLYYWKIPQYSKEAPPQHTETKRSTSQAGQPDWVNRAESLRFKKNHSFSGRTSYGSDNYKRPPLLQSNNQYYMIHPYSYQTDEHHGLQHEMHKSLQQRQRGVPNNFPMSMTGTVFPDKQSGNYSLDGNMLPPIQTLMINSNEREKHGNETSPMEKGKHFVKNSQSLKKWKSSDDVEIRGNSAPLMWDLPRAQKKFGSLSEKEPMNDGNVMSLSNLLTRRIEASPTESDEMEF